MNYKVCLSYDGSDFYGSAIQKASRTVQSEIEKSLTSFFKTPVKVIFASRTDRFVHAKQQVFNFKINQVFDISNLMNFLNHHLACDIIIRSIKKVPDSFHARYDCLSKTYVYIINFNNDIFQRRYQWFYNKNITVEKLKSDSQYFIGKHDFLSFSTSKLVNTIRTINWIKFSFNHKKLKIYINGNGFLRSMVRMIIGTLIYENHNPFLKDKIITLLQNPAKGKAAYKAPAFGLYLYKLYY